MQLPKHWLKSRNFQEECVFSAVELLSVHFFQWTCHISFPELATTSLIRLRKFHEIATTESLRRVVKRLIDQACALENCLVSWYAYLYFCTWGMKKNTNYLSLIKSVVGWGQSKSFKSLSSFWSANFNCLKILCSRAWDFFNWSTYPDALWVVAERLHSCYCLIFTGYRAIIGEQKLEDFTSAPFFEFC